MGILRVDRIAGLGGANAITGSVEFTGNNDFLRTENLDDFYLDGNSSLCSKVYTGFPSQPIRVDKNIWEKTPKLFLSYSVDDSDTYECMRLFSKKYDYIMDPHTAVAAEALSHFDKTLNNKTVILSTAHPAKFPKIIDKAGLYLSDIPSRLSSVIDKDEIATKLSVLDDSVFEFIKQNN